MRWLIGALLFLLFLAWPARGGADHYPAEVAYLNGTALITEVPCRVSEPPLGDAVCRLLLDIRAGVFYFVVLRDQEVLRVSKFQDRLEEAAVIFRAPQGR